MIVSGPRYELFNRAHTRTHTHTHTHTHTYIYIYIYMPALYLFYLHLLHGLTFYFNLFNYRETIRQRDWQRQWDRNRHEQNKRYLSIYLSIYLSQTFHFICYICYICLFLMLSFFYININLQKGFYSIQSMRNRQSIFDQQENCIVCS